MTHQALLRPTANTADTTTGILQRKCACGNAASNLSGECEECQHDKALGLQARLTIGASDDPLEHEADCAAAQVIRMGHADLASDRNAVPRLSRRSTHHVSREAAAPPSVHHVLQRPGEPLSEPARAFFEPRFGHDFGQVRIHHDAHAAHSARDVNALAYTVGRNVVFGQGQYAPDSRAGRELLAHELAHVVQQGAIAPGCASWAAHGCGVSAGGVLTSGSQGVLRRAPAPTPVPGGVPGAPGRQYSPTLPGGARNIPPTQATAASSPSPAAANTICPACACTSDQASRIDAGRQKAETVLKRSAGLLAKPSSGVEQLFEDSFGAGSNTSKAIAVTADLFRDAAAFLAQSTVSDPPGSGNIHCDPTNTTALCAGGASAHYGQGNVVICTENPSPKQMLNPPKVDPVYQTQGTFGSTEEAQQIPDSAATRAKQQASDARFATRVTAVLAHEAIHHVIRPGVVDVYTNERLFQFLGGSSKKLGVDLSPLALQNPDSLVLFAFRNFVMDAGADALPGAEEALAPSEKLSGKLSIRPLLGRRGARLAVALAEEAIGQAGERLSVLLSEVRSVQGPGRPSNWTPFPSLSKHVVSSLVRTGKETDFSQPNNAALTRLETIVDAFSRLEKSMREGRVVLGRRFLMDRSSRIEIAVPDWRAFRKMTPLDQMSLVLTELLNTEPDIAQLNAFVLDLAKSRGGMGKL